MRSGLPPALIILVLASAALLVTFYLLAGPTTAFSADGQWVLVSRHVQMPPGAVAYNPSPSAYSAWEPAEGHGTYQTQLECLKAAEASQRDMARQLPRSIFQFDCVQRSERPSPPTGGVDVRPPLVIQHPDCQPVRNPDGTVQVYRTVHPDGVITYTNCPPGRGSRPSMTQEPVDPRGPQK
jgi:hypothetical protein